MLMWAAEHGVAKLACRIAVCLEEPRRAPHSVDLEPSLRSTLPTTLLRRSERLEKQLLAFAKTDKPTLSSQREHPSAAVVIAQAYPDWIAKRRTGEAGRYQLACGAGVVIADDDPLSHSSWLVVAELGGAGSQARIFAALDLQIDELQRYSPSLFDTVDYLDWDDRQERVLAEHRVMLERLLVDARPMQSINSDDKATALLAGVRKRGLSCLPWTTDCREWQARVQRMQGLSLPRDRFECNARLSTTSITG